MLTGGAQAHAAASPGGKAAHTVAPIDETIIRASPFTKAGNVERYP